MAKTAIVTKPSRKEIMERKAEAIAKCHDASGRVTPKALVSAARDPEHPCHNDFDWDDASSAQRDRERTAAELIRQVRFIVHYEDRDVAVPKYVSDPRVDESSYIPTTRVAQNSPLSQKVLRDELDRIVSAIRRAMNLAAAFGLVSFFENMLEQATAIERHLGDGDEDGDEATAT